METSKPIFLQVLMAVVLVFLGASLEAATFVVDRTDDDAAASACTDAENDCSLRGAITNASVAVDQDEITFQVSGLILLKDHLPVIGSALTIVGPGAGQLAINGGGQWRIIHIMTGGETVQITGLTLTRGERGVIVSQGDLLKMESCVISENASSSFGSGIFNAGNTTIKNSSIHKNRSGSFGGGIVNQGTLTLTNVTVSENETQIFGGGIYNELGATATLNSVTLTGNKSDSDGDGSGDGGGIFNDPGGVVYVANTIVAGNFDGGDESPDCDGILSSYLHNLVEKTSRCTVVNDKNENDSTTITGQSPQFDQVVTGANGTIAFPLKTTSPAVDSNPTSPCETFKCGPLQTLPKDQFGQKRAGPVDRGAHEYQLRCGDGVVQAFAGEECDGGDGCDLTCRLEKPALPVEEHSDESDSPDAPDFTEHYEDKEGGRDAEGPDSPDFSGHEVEEGSSAAVGGCSLIRSATPPAGPAEIPASV